MPTYDAIICGAGIAGISSAYHLVRQGMRHILLVDERPPLSLTSDKSTEAYRNWWPGPGDAMVSFMNRSIDLLEVLAAETGNPFHLNRRGYLYATARQESIPALRRSAGETSALGGGPLRIHAGLPDDPAYIPSTAEGFVGQPGGADLLLDPRLIHTQFPYLNPQIVAALHVRRAGWFSAQQLGALLLEEARKAGVELLTARLQAVKVETGRVEAVRLADGSLLKTRAFVNASGPFLKQVGLLLGIDLPVFPEVHLKVAFRDSLGVVPRDAPLLIWSDPQFLEWTAEERELLAESGETRWLLGELPAGAHTRPEGPPASPNLLMLWEYRLDVLDPPVFPVPIDPLYADLTLRGLCALLPGLRAYLERAPRPVVDGGYYTKTRENRPLIGPHGVEGAYLAGALSGYGLMAAMAAGELLAAHVCALPLPPYAAALSLERYSDPTYQRLLEAWGESGQL